MSKRHWLDSDPGILVTPGIKWGDSGWLREEHRAGQLPAHCPGSQDLNESDSLQVALPTITQKATESAIWKFVRYGRDDVQVLAGLPIGLAIIGMTYLGLRQAGLGLLRATCECRNVRVG